MEVTVQNNTVTCHVKNQEDMDAAMFLRERFDPQGDDEFHVTLGDQPAAKAPAKPKSTKTTKTTKAKADPKPKAQEAPPAETPPAEAAPAATKEVAQETLKQYAALAGVDKARAALAKYGDAQKISDLSDEDRAKFVADLKKDMPTNG